MPDVEMVEVDDNSKKKSKYLDIEISDTEMYDSNDDSIYLNILKKNFVKKNPGEWEDDEDTRSEAKFRFKINDFSNLKENRLSEPCYVRNLPWRIMAMPRFNQDKNYLGFFLQCNGNSDSTNWTCNAVAELRLVSQKPGCEDLVRNIEHLFFAKENDWGFTQFISFQDIQDPEKGFLKDDTIILEVNVQADAPHGVQWDSKKHTGYVGLKNQGATCYMNSLLQTLFFTNKLRKAVYQMPTESDDSSKSVALALQRVFYELQFSDKPVGTKKLTKSFGWETLDSFMQHDVQELCRVLLDNMESKMKSTCVSGTIPKLFEGKMISFIRCKYVDFKSTRTEPFYDIQLNIKGKKNIYESFLDYTSVETLDGENKYDAGIHGLQEAEKGIFFDSFPPVLHLHLLRFQYDPLTDTNVKINDKFEFYEKIDLVKYLKDQSQPALYNLHAVLVHSGDNHGGHYVVFINPKGDGKWCKFDDDVVSNCSKTEAVRNNFGSSEDDVPVKQCTNAYMLVYIKENSDVLDPVTEDSIPPELIERLQEEKRQETLRRKERNDAHLYLHISAYTESSFYGHRGNDLFDLEKTIYKSFRVKKQATYLETLKVIGNEMNYPPEGIRLWQICRRTNEAMRPSAIDLNGDPDRTIEEIAEKESVFLVFLELVKPSLTNTSLPSIDKSGLVLLFFKYYDPVNEFISYCGYDFIDETCKLSNLVAILNLKANLPKNTELAIYEETRPEECNKLMNMQASLKEALEDLIDGDIIVFQKANYENYHNLKLPTVLDYYKDLNNRIEVILSDKTIPNDPGFTLELSKNMNYEEISKTVAQHLNTDPYLIQFFKIHSYKDMPTSAIECSYRGTLKDLLLSQKSRGPKKLYYQLLTIRINELEYRKLFKCTWINTKLKDEKVLLLYPNKSGTVHDLLELAKNHLSQVVNQSSTSFPEGSGKLRLLDITSCKIMQIMSEDVLLECLNPGAAKSYRIEEIPMDELNLAPNEFLMPVAHFNKEINQTFGTPFLLKIRQKETVFKLKERIQKKIDVSDKEFEKYKFALVVASRVQYVDNVDMPISKEELQMHVISNNSVSSIYAIPWLGLDHVNKAPKRPRYNYLEKPIKILN